MRSRPYFFHVLLVPVFYILHLVNQFYAVLPVFMTLKFLLYYLALSILVFLAAKSLLSSAIKAACWTTFTLALFFFFGPFYDFLRKIHSPVWLSGYSFLLPVIGFTVIIVFILIKRTTGSLKKVNSFLNILFGLLVLSEIMIVIFHAGTTGNKRYGTPALSAQISSTGRDHKPDIFFIVFDEYASSLALKKYLNYDNSRLDTGLRKAGFYISEKSSGNYNSTTLSLASTFNMNYFDLPLEGRPSSFAEPGRTGSINSAQIVSILRSAGYDFRNIGVFNVEDKPCPGQPFFNDLLPRVLYLQTLAGRIYDDLWPRHESFTQARQRAIQNMSNIYTAMNELKTESDTPKFVYIHVLMPHTPYCFDRNGNFLEYPVYHAGKSTDDSLYIGQLEYANKFILEMAGTLKEKFQRPRVVIIEGDHGKRDRRYPYDRQKQFMNLNSYYFSDHDYSMLYESVSPVNSFRVILNKYFNMQLPLLKDSSVLVKGI